MRVLNIYTQIGCLPIWCSSCNKGIRISRVEIPKHALKNMMYRPWVYIKQIYLVNIHLERR